MRQQYIRQGMVTTTNVSIEPSRNSFVALFPFRLSSSSWFVLSISSWCTKDVGMSVWRDHAHSTRNNRWALRRFMSITSSVDVAFIPAKQRNNCDTNSPLNTSHHQMNSFILRLTWTRTIGQANKHANDENQEQKRPEETSSSRPTQEDASRETTATTVTVEPARSLQFTRCVYISCY